MKIIFIIYSYTANAEDSPHVIGIQGGKSSVRLI